MPRPVVDFARAALLFTGLVEPFVIRRGAAAADADCLSVSMERERKPSAAKTAEVKHNTVAQETTRARWYAGWNLVEDELVATHVNGVTRVGAALVARDYGRFRGQNVHDLAFALIAPLGANHDQAARAHFAVFLF
jgi:hypothetical protein